MSVYDITLSDPTDNSAPPDRVLRVTSVDEMVFLTIETYDDGRPARTFTEVAEIAVSLPALKEALALLSTDGQREDARQVDKRGERGAKIAGTRYSVVPL